MKGQKKQIHLPNKITYGAVIGMILIGTFFALLYGLTIRHNRQVAEKEMQVEQTKEVSGQVSTEERKKEDATEAKKSVTEEEKAASAQVREGYNGVDKLDWPLLGNVILPYSMDTTVYFETLDQYQCNSGLFIQATENTKVKNICSGRVKEVTKDDKYGTIVTVDMGGGYTATYGQMQKVKVKSGDKVESGQTIGYVAKPTDFFTLEGSHLYLEIQKGGHSVNPVEVLE